MKRAHPSGEGQTERGGRRAALPGEGRHRIARALQRPLAAAAAATLIAIGGRAGAAETQSLGDTGIHPNLAWAATQLIPSPSWHVSGEATRFGLRWQLTPLLYSFGANRRLSPWRSLLVEPIARHAGSLELHASPEYVFQGGDVEDRVQLTGGLRAYFPLIHRGETLSCSLGGAAIARAGALGAAYEAGIYTLFGAIGLQLAYTPTAALRGVTLTLNLRYF